MNTPLSLAFSSSSQQKHDSKLKSVAVAVEEETMNNPQNINKIYICRTCKGAFLTPHALGRHRTTNKEHREMERQKKIQIESKLSDEGFLMKASNKDKSNLLFGGSSQDGVLTENTSLRDPLPSNNYGSHALPNDINLDLTLGPSNNTFNSSFNRGVTRGTTSIGTLVRPQVSRYRFVAGNPLASLIRNIPPSIPPTHPNTNLCHGLFSLQGNDLTLGPSNNTINSSVNREVTRGATNMGTTLVRPQVSRFHFVAGNPLASIIRNTPPSIPPTHPNTNLCHGLFSLQANGSGSSCSTSLISKGKNKAMVPEDDDNKDTGMIRWLTKKKRS